MNAQAVFEKYHLARQESLKADVKELARIRQAISARDLAKVNIAVLLVMEKHREARIAERMAELEDNANLCGLGMNKDLLTACNDDEDNSADVLMRYPTEDELRLENADSGEPDKKTA